MGLPKPLLCLVTDRKLVPEGELAERVRAAVAGGVGMVQVREKDLPTKDLAALAAELKAACEGRALLLVNGNMEAALEAGADGVHLPEEARGEGLGVRERARRPFLLGRSVHSVTAALRAEAEGADYLIAGTVFETQSHPGKEPEGLAMLRTMTGTVRVPVLGIGGITAANAPAVMEAGAAGVAVISAILGAADPERAARELAERVGAVRGGSFGRNAGTLPASGRQGMDDTSMINVTVNGKKEMLEGPTALTDYLKARLDPNRMVAIGHNGEVVHRQEWERVVLKDGDVLDIVHMVGGGC